MAHLTPERRVDKNGKAVTRHVRAGQRPTGSARAIPAPGLTTGADTSTAPFGIKPRPKQLERRHLGMFVAGGWPPSEELWDSPDEGQQVRLHRLSYAAEVSDVEFYDVLSAVRRPVDALKLASKGARSATEARALLAERSATHLGADMTGAARRALETNVDPRDLIRRYESFSRNTRLYGDAPRRPEDIVDAVRLAATSLAEDKYFDETAHAIAEGRIRFEDIKAVGITTLKPNDWLRTMHGAFKRLAAGEGDGDALTLKRVIQRATELDLNGSEDFYLGVLLANASMTRVAEADSLKQLVKAFGSFRSGIGRPHQWSDEEAAERAFYHESLGDAVPSRGPEFWQSVGFFEAGIPADIARAVLSSGGNLETARGIQEEGIGKAVADGWL